MLKYKVVIIDEDEARQEVVTTGKDGLAKAMKIANANRWATIYSIS